MKKIIKVLSIVGAIFILIAGYVYGAASGPGGATGITQGSSTKFNASNYPAASIYAQSGNVTEINVSAPTQTNYWTGYYGEVTGEVVLDDARNNTLYTWTELEPTGEIYSSINNTIDWTIISCFNYTGWNTTGGTGKTGDNVTYWEQDIYNMYITSQVGINETFGNGSISDGSAHEMFWVGETQIAAGSCPAIDTYEQSSSAGTNFQEVLLIDNSSLIFTSVLENDIDLNTTDVIGFDNQTHDFQMLVAEDGSADNVVTTQYFFWLELS